MANQEKKLKKKEKTQKSTTQKKGKSYKIAVIPGDGTGPEVIREGIKVFRSCWEKI